LAKALNLSVEELAQLLSAIPAASDGVVNRLGSAALPAVGNPGLGYDAEDGDVQRRTFLKAFAASGATGALAATGIETLRHELVDEIGGEPADLADWEAIAWEYGRSFAATPPSILLEDLALDLFVAREWLGALRDGGRRADLQRVIAQLAVFMAHTLGNLGKARASYRWWRVAQGCAADAADNETRIWVAGRQMIGGLYEHRPLRHLLVLADEAMAVTTSPGIGTGSLLIGRAQVLAAHGRGPEAIHAMQQVYSVVDRLPVRVTTDVDSLYGWPEHRLRHGESFVYSHLGDHRQAEAAQTRALALYPPHMPRERAQIQLHQALCIVRAGDVSGGVAHAYRVLVDLPEVQMTEVVLEVARSVTRAVPVKERGRAEVDQLWSLLTRWPTSGSQQAST
jgi:hypothetical protein